MPNSLDPNRARCTVGPDLDTNRLQNWKEYQQTTVYKTYYNFLLLLNSAIMNKLYHTEKIYLLVPLFHVSFRERLAPGDAFLSPNTNLLAKDFSLAQVRSFSLLCKIVERHEKNRQPRVTAEAPV